MKFDFGDLTEEQKKNQTKLFGDNTITTTKYNIFTWIPKSLFMQFLRIANIYFLIITILTAMPFSPKNPFTQVLTFAFMLIFTMLKEAYEDYKRYIQDISINNKTTEIYSKLNKKFSLTQWWCLKTGDLIRVKKK
jgi:phospholipid-transporting ATPase